MAHHQIILKPLFGRGGETDGDIDAGDPATVLARCEARWTEKLQAERKAHEEEIRRLQAESAAARRQAELQGYERGHREAAEQHEKRLAGALAALHQAAAQVREGLDSIVAGLEPQTLRLAVALAEKVMAAELRSDPQTLSAVLRDALRHLQGRAALRARLNPDDAKHIKACPEQPETSSIELTPDPDVPAGSCVIETESGEFDASIDTRLQEAVNALWEQSHARDH